MPPPGTPQLQASPWGPQQLQVPANQWQMQPQMQQQVLLPSHALQPPQHPQLHPSMQPHSVPTPSSYSAQDPTYICGDLEHGGSPVSVGQSPYSYGDELAKDIVELPTHGEGFWDCVDGRKCKYIAAFSAVGCAVVAVAMLLVFTSTLD